MTAAQRAGAVECALGRLLHAITVGGLRFDDAANGNRLQERIDRALAEVEREQVVHLWPAAILRTCSEDLTALAEQTARDAVFSEGETVIAIDDL